MKRKIVFWSGALILGLMAIPAFAGTYSDILDQGEDTVADIINQMTGAAWSLGDINTGSANRVFDYSVTDEIVDQIWQDGESTITFTAIWWSGSFQPTNPVHHFGYKMNGDPEVELFDTSVTNPGDSVFASIPISHARKPEMVDH